MAASNTGSNQSFDTLLRLLPGSRVYPRSCPFRRSKLISQLNQLTAALPQILEKLGKQNQN